MTQPQMTERTVTKLFRVGDYAAEVEVTLICESDTPGWGATITPRDVQKLEVVKKALSAGDIKTASKLAQVYTLSPVIEP